MIDRARLGLIVPSTNTTVEREITGLARETSDWFVSRVLQLETDDPAKKIGTVLSMQDELSPASERLAGFGPAALGFACTAASFLSGADSDIQLCSDFSDRLGVPFLTASRAVAYAIEALGVTRVALVTPYIHEVNEREIGYFREVGIEVVSSSGLGIVGNLPKGRLPATASSVAALDTPLDGAEAVFISCTNWLTLANIDPLTRSLGVPVISSNSALAWAVLRASGVESAIAGVGPIGSLSIRKRIGL